MYSCDGKAEFSAAITPVFSVTWSFRSSESKSPNQPSSSPINPPPQLKLPYRHCKASHIDFFFFPVILYVPFLILYLISAEGLWSFAEITVSFHSSRAESVDSIWMRGERASCWRKSFKSAGEAEKKRCGWEEIDLSRGARVNQQQADSKRTYNTEVLYKNEANSQHRCSAFHQAPCRTAMRGWLELYSQKAITWSKWLFSLEMQQGDYQPETT